ncbi:TrmH family RNA methyltransferase [Kineobactrum salinum]|uniref:RNA methyltransferase n=1 Tax=Kineobactrum salinum TaxID=2708301 RepID=A0A6C0U5A2_9GAMM|nr:RNA methyltransferase [Kineobactrum salinum]QIB67340.1 RNA methyltransferase [Kineobactrum salinum]
MPDRPAYAERKAFFKRMLTVYGRKPVLEALQDRSLNCHALHLADSNREGGVLADIVRLAQQRAVPVHHHSRVELARISRNGRQDQGVAADILCPGFRSLEDYLGQLQALPRQRLLALDGISNPQNLGMIIRSAAAGAIDGIVCARRGNAALGPLVIKASAGTLYRAPLMQCESLAPALQQCRRAGFEVCTLRADAACSLFQFQPRGHCIYVLGNETEGVSAVVEAEADRALNIPMRNGVESLNVAVTASLIAFADYLDR